MYDFKLEQVYIWSETTESWMVLSSSCCYIPGEVRRYGSTIQRFIKVHKGVPSQPTSTTWRVSEAEVLSDVHSFVADIPRPHPRIGSRKNAGHPLLFGSKRTVFSFDLITPMNQNLQTTKGLFPQITNEFFNLSSQKKTHQFTRILYRYPRQCTAWFQPCCSQYM